MERNAGGRSQGIFLKRLILDRRSDVVSQRDFDPIPPVRCW